MMRAIFLLISFTVDVVLKVLARTNPDALGRFSFSTSVGTIGLAPSVNSVLAFSLPVPNQYIWPIGWAVVFVLAAAFLRNENSKLETRNSKQIQNSNFKTSDLFRISPPKADPPRAEDFGFRISDRQLAILAIILGAFSNLTDRTFLGGVTDYLSFTNLFPAFNVADLLIIGGIIAGVYRGKEKRPT